MKYSNNSPKLVSKRRIKRIVFMVLVLLLLVSGLSVSWYRNRNNNETGSEISAPGTEKIDLSPPTEADKQAVDDNKTRIAEKDSQNAQAPSAVTNVTPTIVDASYYASDQVFELSAYVSGVFESTGVCKVTLTKGSVTVSRESVGFKNSSYTSCTPISIPLTSFPSAGEWSVVVNYTSPTAQGNSQPKTVRID